MNLSPWFYTSEPPVRTGVYQLKNYVGHIAEAYWDGAHFLHTGRHIRAGLRIGTDTIYRSRANTAAASAPPATSALIAQGET